MEEWCAWVRVGRHHWIQWDMSGPWTDSHEHDNVPFLYGPRTQCWLWMGTTSFFRMDADLFYVFGPMGARPVYKLGDDMSDYYEGFGNNQFNTEWGYVHYCPPCDALGGTPEIRGLYPTSVPGLYD